MRKLFPALGAIAAALVISVAPAGAQTPGDITATITAATSNPTAGSTVIVTGTFSIPALSQEAASVQITSSVGPVALVSFTPGLSSCIATSTSVTCTWSTPDSAAPQTLVISAPAGAAGTITFNALSSTIGGTPAQEATTSVTVSGATTTTVAGTTTTTAAATTTVAPPPTEAPTTTVAPTTTASGSLPATGSNSGAPLVIALVAIAAGVLLVGGTRLLKNKS